MDPEGLAKAAFSALLGIVCVILGFLYIFLGPAIRTFGAIVAWGLPLLGIVFFVAAYLRLRHELTPQGPDKS